MALEAKIAETDEELDKVFQIRYKVYTEVNYMDKEEFPDQKESDEFDKISTNFLVWYPKTGQVVGAIRAIPDSNIGYPMENIFNLSDLRKDLRENSRNAVEVSRRVTWPLNNGRVNVALLSVLFQYCKKNSITDWIAAIDEPALDYYKKLGMNIIGDKVYYGLVNRVAYPVQIEIDNFSDPYISWFSKKNPNIKV